MGLSDSFSGKKETWVEQGLIMFQSQAHWPSGKCAVKDYEAEKGFEVHSGDGKAGHQCGELGSYPGLPTLDVE